jgi:plasmid stabilization system protein ParE
MPYPVLVPAAEADIDDVLAFTLERFGEVKYGEYIRLIEAALQALADDPSSGRSRPTTPVVSRREKGIGEPSRYILEQQRTPLAVDSERVPLRWSVGPTSTH